MGRALKLLSFFLLCHCCQALASPRTNNSTDELALLSFKSMLSSSSGPSSILASWNTSSHFCSWTGVVCGRRHPDRVVALRMGSFNLSGCMSPFLGNLSFLRELDLHDNQLVGRVSPELGHLGRLQLLNVSLNHLNGSIPVTLGACAKLTALDLRNNKFQGGIPYEIGDLKRLVFLNLEKNGLSGEIPQSLAGLVSIRYLALCNNRLSGNVPPSWGNLTNLHLLDLSDNMLSGVIPSSLGLLSSLSWLDLSQNNLSGLVPISLWNISSITRLSVSFNLLSGTIPENAFGNVPHLQKLYMDTNQFHGPIPVSVYNASSMMELQLNDNFFSGIVPPEVAGSGTLKCMQLNGNSFEAKEPKDWQFITALTNCSELNGLALGNNKFGGALPDSLSNLSASLTSLILHDNGISGSIPEGIGNLINLQALVLSNNFFTGSLPSSLCRLTNLVVFFAHDNKILGPIPPALGNLTRLLYLYIHVNALSGTIPSTIGNLTMLLQMSLSHNYLSGPIPSAIFNIVTISNVLDLSNNNLEGSVPREIGNLKNLIKFHAESNKLSGEIPAAIGECQLLQHLSLRNNILNGGIPLFLSQMKGLEILDLSSNKLSGQIPKSLGNITMLYYLNLSFNNLYGEVPNYGVFSNVTAISIQGNGNLCGGIPDLHLPTCSSQVRDRKHKSPVIFIATSLVMALFILPLLCKLLVWRKKRETRPISTQFMEWHPLISYSQLVRATNGFSETNLLGSGSFGSVYKGELNAQEGEGANIVAVKVMKLQDPNALKTFTTECKALRNMRHRNLVKIVTICSSIDTMGSDFKAIVYDFIPNGSLEGWLHPDTNDQGEQRYLNLSERVNILLDVAYALDYLHFHGPVQIVHCDLKSSNVLLDDDMVAHVGDFGIAKILMQGTSSLQQSTSSMGFRGTIGYAAPEYGAGNMVSTHGDIYSYGVLVLETMTGNRPTSSRIRQGLSLREFVDLALHNKTMDAVDTRLSVELENELHTIGPSSYKRKMDYVASLLSLGVSCTQELPSSRMSTQGIIKELLTVKNSLQRERTTS